MIKSILLAADASRHAVTARDQAIVLAKAYDAKLIAVSVLDVRLLEMPPYLDYAYPFETIAISQFPVELLEGFRVKAERVLEDTRLAAVDEEVAVETRLEEGVPGEVLADLGDTTDIIVIGKRGEHAKWGKDLLGSITEGVVRRAATPVLITELEVSPLRSFAVLYDGSHPANRTLKLVANMATRLQASLQILTAGGKAEEVAQLQDGARRYLEPFSLSVSYHGLKGGPVQVLPEHLKKEPADVVAMGKKGHSLLQRLILGSTAEHLMRVLPVPVLLVP